MFTKELFEKYCTGCKNGDYEGVCEILDEYALSFHLIKEGILIADKNGQDHIIDVLENTREFLDEKELDMHEFDYEYDEFFDVCEKELYIYSGFDRKKLYTFIKHDLDDISYNVKGTARLNDHQMYELEMMMKSVLGDKELFMEHFTALNAFLVRPKLNSALPPVVVT